MGKTPEDVKNGVAKCQYLPVHLEPAEAAVFLVLPLEALSESWYSEQRNRTSRVAAFCLNSNKNSYQLAFFYRQQNKDPKFCVIPLS